MRMRSAAPRTLVLVSGLLLMPARTFAADRQIRPFIGAPFLPVEFFRPNAFEGSFFEAVTFAARQIFSS